MTDKIKNIVITLTCALLVLVIFVIQLAVPSRDISESERRAFEKLPEVSISAISSGKFMQKFDSFAMDQFPLRDKFRALKALSGIYVFRQSDKGGLYISDGYISKTEYPMDIDSLQNATEKFSNIYEKHLKGSDNKIYFSLIYDKNYFMARANGYPSIDYDEMTRVLTDGTPFMRYIDISDLLSLDDYYKTDTHWRQEKIVDVAQRLAGEMGVALSTDDLEEHTLDKPFYGVYYGQMALPLESESLNYLTSSTIDACTVYDYESDSVSGMYNMTLAHGKDPYEMFLSGSRGILKITNPLADNDKRLIVFRDSFASSIAPLLATGYSEVTLVDIRYVSSELIGNIIDFNDSDILFLYSTLVLNNSITLK